MAIVLLAACGGSAIEPGDPLTFRIVEGACGEVAFVQNIGTDLASAFRVLEARKAERFGEGVARLEVQALEVVDARGRVPAPGFYAIRVVHAQAGTFLHSVLEVITTEGDLFHLRWCPD